MGWIILIVFVVLLEAFLDSLPGKIVVGTSVIALGLLLLSWITGFGFFITLAKVCAVIIVIAIVGAILVSIAG